MVGRRARYEKAAVEMHVNDGAPFFFRHVEDKPIPQDSGVVHDDVDTAETFDGCLHNAVCAIRSEEHTSELQSLMRISYAVFCLKKKNTLTRQTQILSQYTIKI